MLSPDPTLCEGKGIETFVLFLGCADSAVMWADPHTTLFVEVIMLNKER